jgi:hypothetical protein
MNSTTLMQQSIQTNDMRLVPGNGRKYIEPERQLGQEAPAAPAQAQPRTPGSRPTMYHVCVNTAGLHAPAAMGRSGRLEFDSSNHGLC